MPVSVRTPEQLGTGGNQSSFMLSALPTDEPDPTARLQLLNSSLAGAKQRFTRTPATLLHAYSAVLPQLFHGSPPAPCSGLPRRSGRRRSTCSAPTCPALQLPLYTAGASVTGMFPVSVVSDIGGGVNITVLSYNGHLDFGFIACRDTVP